MTTNSPVNIVITGATSFIGTHLLRSLAEKGHNIYAVIRPNSPNEHLLPKMSNVKILPLDMEDYDKLGENIPSPCDFFINLAWVGARGDSRNKTEIHENNYKNSVNALKSLSKNGLTTLVTGGSQAEYGEYDYKIKEDFPCNPITAYGKSKLDFYNFALEFCQQKNIRLIEPRFFSVYGVGDFEGSMVMSILNKMLKHEDCPLTHARQMWDFMYIDDAVKVLIKLMFSDSAHGVYNFASGVSKPLKEFIEEMKIISNSKSKLLYGAINSPSTKVINLEADVEKLQRISGGGNAPFDICIREIIKTLKS